MANCEATQKTGIYKIEDNIKNLHFRVKVKKVRWAGLDSRSIDRSFSDEELYTFQWQQKVFSKSEIDFYSKETNCMTDLDKKYHCDIKNCCKTEKLFSYLHEDEFPGNEENVTTEVRPSMTYLQKEMSKLKLEDIPEYNEMDEAEFDMLKSIQKNIKQPFYINKYEYMYIMADLGRSDTETSIWLKSEHVLCTLKHDTIKQILYVYPDFSSTDKCPYVLEVGDEGKVIYEYYIENVSKRKSVEKEEKETDVLQKIIKRNQDDKSQIIGKEFQMPSKNQLRVHLFFEILTAKCFEYDNIYIQYNIELPEFWQCQDEKYLCGSTQTCKTKGFERIANFGHNFDVVLEYNMKELNKDGILRYPYVYFQVLSRDSWDRYRCEGIAYKAIPIFQTGVQNYELTCVRVLPTSPVGDLRRYFIGDYGSIDDISWIGLPKDYENATLNKYGVKTIGTGTIDIRLNILNQSKSLMRTASQSNDRISMVEGFGTISLVKSVEEVVNAFRRAQERMQKARRLVLERKKVKEEN